MMRDFADKETERLFQGRRSRRFSPKIQPRAAVLLAIMDAVAHWTELRAPPGNQLHALSGDRAGQYAIRVNRQWRIAFTPNDDGSMSDVEVTDYH